VFEEGVVIAVVAGLAGETLLLRELTVPEDTVLSFVEAVPLFLP
jgi:hypothetical protein